MSDYSNQPDRGSDPLYWLIAFGLMFTGVAAPVGILMIVMKLLDGKKKRGRHPYYTQQSAQEPMGARTVQDSPRPAPSAQTKKKKRGRSRDLLAELDQKGRRWTFVGGAVAAVCFLGLIGSMSDTWYALHWLLQGDLTFFLEELTGPLVLLCCAAGGLGFAWAGLRKRKQARRYRNYLAMIGHQTTISISSLASATGLSPAKVRDDLADMLDDGLFPQGFLDYGGDRLVLSGDGLQQSEPQPKQETPAPPKEDENSILEEIRAVNDAIDNEKLSAQIDRVGVITAKILDYQKTHPDKAPQLHSFLSYYLPTTLKILRAYGQLEDQEVSGANITAAMKRIEGMMDKVVEGFEKQLDLLFQGDAMDIATDVEVLERMLAKDGLSDQSGLTLGL